MEVADYIRSCNCESEELQMYAIKEKPCNNIELAEAKQNDFFMHRGAKFYVDGYDEWRKKTTGSFTLDDFGCTFEVEYKMASNDVWHNLGQNFFHKDQARKALIDLMREKGSKVYRVRYIEELSLM